MTMHELAEQILSWKLLLLVLVVFGVAPVTATRLMVLAYPRDHPRRDELVAEIYEVPWHERPLWTSQHLVTVIAEGLGPRIYWAIWWLLVERVFLRWELKSGVESNRRSPKTFWIPSPAERARVAPGCAVQLMFQLSDGWCERMWVEVDKVGHRRLTGRLSNQPVGFPRLSYGDRVKFKPDHIINIDWEIEPDSGPR